MTDVDPGALALARMRARGTNLRIDGADPEAVHRSARAAGRVVLDTTVAGLPAHVLGWQEGHEPSPEEGRGVEHRRASRIDLEVFAACLGCCWSDRDSHPWPGVPRTREDILLAIGWARERDDRQAVSRYRSALERLERAQWVEFDGIHIHLGPRVRTWNRAEVDILRGVFDHLPRLSLAEEPEP
ncbi:hypothetical protein GTW20_21070 [Nocardiopsis alba]|uniref:Uncharacterized protein n=1 Tax=Nocardiopsis alba TaxID=53437 RepID=A0A7K2IXG9_9ACTN|nr:hypothetical protein [Nocardiopsis alba]MYR34671.1 hypothetical protein [Nocardiopsis alba]